RRGPRAHGQGHLRHLPRLRGADRAGQARGDSLDPCLHQLQTEAELVRTDVLLSTLKAFHRDKLTLRQRHVAVARQVSQYDANNTYQYVINREDVHLQWLESAIIELEGTPDTVA